MKNDQIVLERLRLIELDGQKNIEHLWWAATVQIFAFLFAFLAAIWFFRTETAELQLQNNERWQQIQEEIQELQAQIQELRAKK